MVPTFCVVTDGDATLVTEVSVFEVIVDMDVDVVDDILKHPANRREQLERVGKISP